MPVDNKQPLWQRILMGGAVVEAPSIMTAAGHKIEKDGTVTVENQNDTGVKQLRSSLPVIAATAISVAAPTTLSAVNNYLNGYKYYRFGKNILNRALTAYDIYDSSKTLFGDDGVRKTINLVQNGDYWKAVKSGIGDVALALGPIGYLKDINFVDNLVSDLKFANKVITRNKPLATNIYNLSRPIIRTGINISGVRDAINPMLYSTLMLNAGNKNGLQFLNIFKRNPFTNPLEGIRRNMKLNWALAKEENLDKVYKQYLFKDTMWENIFPSGLTKSTDPLATKLFSTRGRYSELPIYNLDLNPNKNIPFNYTSVKNPHFIKRNDKWEFSHRGTYDKKGRGKFKPVTAPNQSPFSFANLDIGGHYMAATPRHDLNKEYPYAGFGNPQKWFDIGIMDTQHFTPDEYISKWKESKWKTLPITTLDMVGRDFNLFGKGTFSYQAPWTNYSDDAVVTFHKDIQPLNESFISKWKKQ